MFRLYFFLATFFAGVSSLHAAPTNATEMVFTKTLQPNISIEVFKTEILYVPLSRKEIENGLNKLPPGSQIIEPTRAYRYDFFLRRKRVSPIIFAFDAFSKVF